MSWLALGLDLPRRFGTDVRLRALRRLNRGLSDAWRIEPRITWPIWLIPLALLNQLLAPHMIWTVLLVTLAGLYGVALLWVRGQAGQVTAVRRRIGVSGEGLMLGSSTALVAGDTLQEEFVLINRGQLPVVWAEVVDHSTVPDYAAGRVVSVESNAEKRWKTHVVCRRRGVFMLGPHSLRMQDPFGFFNISAKFTEHSVVLIYPRVVHLPPAALPSADSEGADRRRRPLPGNLPAATVADYRPGDSLRHVHWSSTARHGRLMVKDLEIEASGEVWIVLDLYAASQRGEGDAGTLEFGVIVAASLAAQLLHDREQKPVGLLCYSGHEGGKIVDVAPTRGAAHLWSILAALAQVAEGPVALANLLAGNRDRFGRRASVVVVTPRRVLTDGTPADDPAWLVEVAHMRSAGTGAQAVLTEAADDVAIGMTVESEILARMDVASTVLRAGSALAPLLTFRRRRTVLRATPTGGVVRTEIEEEVG